MRDGRRAFITTLCLTALGCGGAWACLPRRAPPHPEYRTLARRLANLPKHRSQLRGLGLAYMRSLDYRPTAAQLAEGWFPTADERKSLLQASRKQLLAHVTDRILSDYRDGKVINVNGWLLSETEGRLAAVVASMRRG